MPTNALELLEFAAAQDAIDAKEIESKRPLEQAVPELVEMALKRGGPRCDNVTVLAMEWEGTGHDEQSSVLTETLGEEVFASTIQASMGNTGTPGQSVGADELDEAEIERSIREINEAIRRSANAARKS